MPNFNEFLTALRNDLVSRSSNLLSHADTQHPSLKRWWRAIDLLDPDLPIRVMTPQEAYEAYAAGLQALI